VISNIQNVSDPKERILDYLQVSAVKKKRKYVLLSEISRLIMPYYYPCVTFEKDPANFQVPYGRFVTLNNVYLFYCITSKYSFVDLNYSLSGSTCKNGKYYA
jgi:hypothetical protein